MYKTAFKCDIYTTIYIKILRNKAYTSLFAD